MPSIGGTHTLYIWLKLDLNVAHPAFFLGDDPAMDFLNTTAAPQGSLIEYIGDGHAYVNWLVTAKLVSNADAKQVFASYSTKQLDEVANEARLLREWFRGCLGIVHKGGAALPARSSKEWLNRLNALLAKQSGYKHLEAGSKGWQLVERQRFDRAEQLLTPVVESICRIFVGPDLTQIKRCASPDCTLWFHDRTKAHSRVYCSPAMCGNRAKVAAYRARQKKH